MTRDEAVAFIFATDGKIFSLEFVKRTTGETRQMVCRLGVTSHLTGGGPSYNAADKGLITVFDMSKNGYRSINIEGIRRIKVAGKWNEVIDNPIPVT